MVYKLKTRLKSVMKNLHFHICHTAVWYMLSHSSNKKQNSSLSSLLATLTFLLVKEFLGGLVLSQDKDHTQRELNEQLRPRGA